MKRGDSGLSFVCGIDKACGMTSHDVVGRIRRICGERRVGHAGTLDPLASGVLPCLIGPATRLSDYLMGHAKEYRVKIIFGSSTTTDDAEGEVIRCSDVPDKIMDTSFARSFLAGIIGKSMQLPPVYSALKVNGRKACDEARRGNVIEIEPREIEVFACDLIGTDRSDLSWTVDLCVSKGTYIRALARDIGNTLGVFGHVGSLRRLRVGNLRLDECVSIETFEEVGALAALDPVRLLGFRFLYADESLSQKVKNGQKLNAESIGIFEYTSFEKEVCACTSGVMASSRELKDDENVCVIADNELKAIYRFDAMLNKLKPDCVFQRGICRG